MRCERTFSRRVRASALGRRRFSKKEAVGASWLSQTEMVFLEDERKQRRWRSFALGVLPAPLFGLACMSGSVGFRAIVTAAFAAAKFEAKFATFVFSSDSICARRLSRSALFAPS